MAYLVTDCPLPPSPIYYNPFVTKEVFSCFLQFLPPLEALSSEETTVEAAITAVSGLSSYFSAVVALAVEAAITDADVAAAADSLPIY